LQLALAASGCDPVRVIHKPRLLSDNGSSYVSADLAEWLDDNGMSHVRGASQHPQTQGKIKRWHQTLKDRILLENYYLPGDPKAHIGDFVEHCNHHRYHESLKNPRQPMSTSAGAKPSWCNGKGSNATPSGNDDCSTK
jgi:putative transposase